MLHCHHFAAHLNNHVKVKENNRIDHALASDELDGEDAMHELPIMHPNKCQQETLSYSCSMSIAAFAL